MSGPLSAVGQMVVLRQAAIVLRELHRADFLMRVGEPGCAAQIADAVVEAERASCFAFEVCRSELMEFRP